MINYKKLISVFFVVVLCSVMVVCFFACDSGFNNTSDIDSSSEFNTSAKVVEKSLINLEPYFDYSSKKLEFDYESAKEAGLSNNDLNVGVSLKRLTNGLLVNGYSEDNFHDSRLIDDLVAFDDFFDAVKSGTTEVQKKYRAKRLDCPEAVYQSAANPKSLVINAGYHLVPSYATGNYGNDYAKFLVTTRWPASFPGRWTYRAQAIVSDVAIRWQEPEPNPELFSYIWPYSWWPAYVYAWHEVC